MVGGRCEDGREDVLWVMAVGGCELVVGGWAGGWGVVSPLIEDEDVVSAGSSEVVLVDCLIGGCSVV